jgi:hypothetical protein
MGRKICYVCKEEKEITCFVNGIRKETGKRYYRNKCKECRNLLDKKNRIPKPTNRITWTDELIKQEALKYNHRIHFIKKSGSAYNAAKKKQILKEVCSHMVPLGSSYRRMVYVYEFEDKHVYVGLTGNRHRRHNQHMIDGRGPVSKHMKETNLTPNYKLISGDYIPREDAQLLETQTLNDYLDKGWIPLNSASTGGLGGSTLIWTDEALRLEALKYKTRKEMIAKNNSAYSTLIRRKLYHLCSHMEWIMNPNNTLEECIHYAKNYNKINDFRKAHPKLYDWIYSHKLNSIVFSHMELKKKWTIEEAVEVSKKYTTLNDFIKNDIRAYNYLVRKNGFDELTKHLSKKKKWTIEEAVEVSKKYTTIKDFIKNDRRAYDYLTKMENFFELTKHLIRVKPHHNSK